jgi:hypothetical protein
MPLLKEKMAEARVMHPSYVGVDGRAYRRGTVISVPESWIEKGTTRCKRGDQFVIVDQALKPIADEQRERAAKENAPDTGKAFDAEVARREGWQKLTASADKIHREAALEAAKQTAAIHKAALDVPTEK